MWEDFIKSFLAREGHRVPWWTDTEKVVENILPQDMPYWVRQFITYPKSYRDGDERNDNQSLKMFQDLHQLSAQWPFSALGFDPFWLFHNGSDASDASVNRKTGRPRPSVRRRYKHRP
ncbi:hypothetical protein [Alicyclobacillus suci]|uniref:hypothetical protein n=1 Tax=Alicyclobacillus suci TaxID=2816080 RepID=UPI001A8F60EF|nr:hypothetical protein [Alicyclobacillus suci]